MHRIIFVLALFPLAAQAELDQWEQNQIRKSYQEQIFNRPATIRNKPADQRYAEKIFPKSVVIDRPAYTPMPEVPEVQVFTGRELEFEQFLSILSKTIGYKPPIFLQVPVSVMKRPVILNSRPHDLASMVSWLETRTGTRIAVYPDSKTIQVSANHEQTAHRSGD